jgi:broad specificity phosphatase PhoE
MGLLYLARHAQASFLQQNYDKLSPLGEAQARLLGEYWAQRKIVFDRVGVGPRERQKDTVNLVRNAYHRATLVFPEPFVLAEFDEYQGEEVLKRGLPQLLETHQAVRDLHAAFQSVGDWVRDALHLPGVETWQQFSARVNSGLAKFLSGSARGERVAIFTSGGPIAIGMQRALHLTAEDTLQMTWMSRNASWSEFFYSGGERFTLSSFNCHAHIEDPAMLTYR